MSIEKTARIGIFGGLAWVISMFSFPLLPLFPFLKVDFSEIVLILVFYLYGRQVGVATTFIRSLLSYLVSFGEAGYPIGDTTAFIASLVFILPFVYFLKTQRQTMWQKIMWSVLATLGLTVVMSGLNVWVVVPLYMKVLGVDVGEMSRYILTGVVPFNLLKGALTSLLFFMIWTKLEPKLKKESGHSW